MTAMGELRKFMMIKDLPSKNRQKLMRNLRVRKYRITEVLELETNTIESISESDRTSIDNLMSRSAFVCNVMMCLTSHWPLILVFSIRVSSLILLTISLGEYKKMFKLLIIGHRTLSNNMHYYIRLYSTVFLLARINTRDVPFSNILISKKQFRCNK